MSLVVKVFDISAEVNSISIDDKQKNNILKIFTDLSEETHLITNCFLDLKSEDHKNSPIVYDTLKVSQILIENSPRGNI